MNVKYDKKMISLMEKNGYSSYCKYLKKDHGFVLSDGLKNSVRELLKGKSSLELKKIRKIYLEDIKR